MRSESIHALPDDEAIEVMTQVKGIGRWSAEMFLMFRLLRRDVMPVDDLGHRSRHAAPIPAAKVPDIKAHDSHCRALAAVSLGCVLVSLGESRRDACGRGPAEKTPKPAATTY